MQTKFSKYTNDKATLECLQLLESIFIDPAVDSAQPLVLFINVFSRLPRNPVWQKHAASCATRLQVVADEYAITAKLSVGAADAARAIAMSRCFTLAVCSFASAAREILPDKGIEITRDLYAAYGVIE